MATIKCKPLPMSISKEQARSFWEKVLVKEKDECWLWQACVDPKGYGHVQISQSVYSAHRVAYFLSTKEDPYPWLVLHKCIGSSGCCNPTHLYLGTHMDNVRDRIEQGRSGDTAVLGERHGMAKLTEEKVREIRLLYARGGVSMRIIGERYDVTDSAIRAIVIHRNWAHVK